MAEVENSLNRFKTNWSLKKKTSANLETGKKIIESYRPVGTQVILNVFHWHLRKGGEKKNTVVYS